MKIKQTIRNTVLGALLVFGLIPAVLSTTANAAKCGNVETSIISCGQDNTDQDGSGQVDAQETGVWGILTFVLNILTALVAVAALGGLIYGAVLYTTAGGKPEQVKKAYGTFTNVVIGIVAWAGMWALLNFLIPGGAFHLL